ncbi:nucleotidyltransferase domain-containing protein [Candidatus Woesearchaeota archaeon]|nr:nucleotidyltransferase domain-containing protein [Candidatus Woesearchaeota archaeon]
MEQKHSTLAVVSSLLKKEHHVRSLAKELNTNHPLISRKMANLLKLNVVDFRQEGRNKVFFLKKTSEAKQYIYMAEHQRIVDTLKEYPTLRRVVKSIQEDKSITLAVMFGSYAKSRAKKESDIDLYIETDSRELKKKVEKTDSRMSVKIGSLDPDNPLTKEIWKNHVILKGVERFYEAISFFG